MNKKFLALFVFIFLISFALGNIANANFLGGLQNTANKVPTYGQPTPPSIIIANIVQGLLAFIGVIFMILFIYGGFLYMTSAGEADKVKKAKSLLRNAVIGVLIVMSAYAITYFISTQIEQSLQS